MTCLADIPGGFVKETNWKGVLVDDDQPGPAPGYKGQLRRLSMTYFFDRLQA